MSRFIISKIRVSLLSSAIYILLANSHVLFKITESSLWGVGFLVPDPSIFVSGGSLKLHSRGKLIPASALETGRQAAAKDLKILAP